MEQVQALFRSPNTQRIAKEDDKRQVEKNRKAFFNMLFKVLNGTLSNK